MTTNRIRWGGCAKAKAFLALGVLMGGASIWWVGDACTRPSGPAPAVRVFGSLPPRDLQHIRRTVQHEVWRRIRARLAPTHFDGPSIRWWLSQIPQMPQQMRDRERIDYIQINPDASVSVGTSVPMWIKVGTTLEDWSCSGCIYTLKKGPAGWQIITSYYWES